MLLFIVWQVWCSVSVMIPTLWPKKVDVDHCGLMSEVKVMKKHLCYCIFSLLWQNKCIMSSVFCPSVLDTVGWVIWRVKIVPNMTYNVFGGTLNPTLLSSAYIGNIYPSVKISNSHRDLLTYYYPLPLSRMYFPSTPVLFLHCRHFLCLKRTWWDGIKRDIWREGDKGIPANPGWPGMMVTKSAGVCNTGSCYFVMCGYSLKLV